MVLKAFTDSLNEIIELSALAAGFTHDDLLGAGLYKIELEPLAPWGKLHGQALVVCDQAEMLREIDDRFSVDELGCTSNESAHFSSNGGGINDLPRRIVRVTQSDKLPASSFSKAPIDEDVALNVQLLMPSFA